MRKRSLSISRDRGCDSGALGVERRSEDSVQITVQVHNKGNRAIHSLDLRAALYGQNLNSAQTVGAEIHDLRPDEARRVSFAPAPPAEVGYTDEGLALVTPLVIVARYGGTARRILPLKAGSVWRLEAARDRRPRRSRAWLGGRYL